MTGAIILLKKSYTLFVFSFLNSAHKAEGECSNDVYKKAILVKFSKS